MRILVAGGAGFIGSAFVRWTLSEHPDDQVLVLDKLTYAGNLENLSGLEGLPNYEFRHGDICDLPAVRDAIANCDAVVNFAAETHVDRSLMDADAFIRTDVYGVYTLLEACRSSAGSIAKFVQVSTDEVYGPQLEGEAVEESAPNPTNPYSASKAGGELLAMAYQRSFSLPVTVVRGSNNMGPRQHPEKFVPLLITNALEDRELPIYGDGLYVREWIYVDDFVRGVDAVLRHGQPGQVYNVGGGADNRRTQLEVAHAVLHLLGKPESLIRHVTDRPGHDRRYAMRSDKVQALGWRREFDFDQALEATVRWYCDNPSWWKKVRSGEYEEYYRRLYGRR
ncbi:MAG: dTDP-glucose 4,6-dehydratase [Armatimonadota bacterium]